MVKPPTTEIGSVNPDSGIPGWGGFIDSADHVPELLWPQSVQSYKVMRRDGQVAALLLGMTLPIRRYRWMIDPNGAADDVVEAIADDLGLPIVGQEETPPRRARGRFSHDKHLALVLEQALTFGHLFCEQVGEVLDGKWRLRKLAPRVPSSIAEIQVASDGGLEWIRQNTGVEARKIPVSRLVAFVWDQEPGSWIGTSMLRPLYKHFVLKDRLLRLDAIKHERTGLGVPVAYAPPDADADTIEHLNRMMQEWRVGEGAGAAVPHGTRVELISGSGGTNITESIRMHDEAMARSLLMMFIQLGQTQSGSRALGETFVDFFALAQETLAAWYASVMNEHVIEDWVDWNVGEGTPAPLLTFQRDENPVLAIGELVQLLSAGAIVADPQLERWLRSQYDLPLPEVDLAELAAADEVVPLPEAPEPAEVAAARGPDFDESLIRRDLRGRFAIKPGMLRLNPGKFGSKRHTSKRRAFEEVGRSEVVIRDANDDYYTVPRKVSNELRKDPDGFAFDVRPSPKAPDFPDVDKGPVARRELGDAKDTREKHTVEVPGEVDSKGRPKRRYTAERRALHERIIDDFLSGKLPTETRKDPATGKTILDDEGNPRQFPATTPKAERKAIFLAGGPASGKSSGLSSLQGEMRETLGSSVHVDPDAIKYELPEFAAMAEARDEYAAAGGHEESSDIAKMLSKRARERDLNVLMDGTGNRSPEDFEAKLRDAHDAGYQIDVVMVDVPTPVAMGRARKRAFGDGTPGSTGNGRMVPPEIIESIHHMVPQGHAHWRHLDFIRSWVLYDTEVPKGKPARLVAQGGGGEYEVLDAKLYERILAKGR